MTNSNGTIPVDTGVITADRPDIVIIDRKNKTISIFELTVSNEMNIDNAHLYKENKYAYFLTDISSLSPTVTAFEVGARGFITKQNSDRLKNLHKFCKKSVKLKTFIDNVSALAVNSSFFIFISRKDPVWCDPPPLIAPFNTTQ